MGRILVALLDAAHKASLRALPTSAREVAALMGTCSPQMPVTRCSRMRPASARFLAPVILSILSLAAFATAPAFAEPAATPAAVDQGLQAFDGDVVGYEGMVVDMKVVASAYNEVDYQIADYKKQIEDLQAHIDLRRRTGGPKADAAITVLEHDIAIAQARIQELQIKKAMRSAANDCAASLKLWQELTAFLTQNMAIEQGYAREASSTDVQADFQNQADRDRSQLATATSEIDRIAQLCEHAEDAAAAERISVALADLNTKAKASAAQAIAIAEKGHFNDLPAAGAKLQIVLGAARLNQLLEHGEDGLAMQRLAFDALRAFESSAPKACMNDSFDIGAVLAVRRQIELLPGEGTRDDAPPALSNCLYRLLEAGGGRIPGIGEIQIRSCTDGFGPSTWQIRVKTRVFNLAGSGDSTTQSGIKGFAQVEYGGDGVAEMSGMVDQADNVTLPYNVTMKGTVKLRVREFKGPKGLVTRRDTSMSIDWTVAEHSVTDVFGHTVTVPASSLTGDGGDELPVVILNNNMPCNPQKSVWNYP